MEPSGRRVGDGLGFRALGLGFRVFGFRGSEVGVLLASPISQGNRRLNFQVTKLSYEPQKVWKAGYWGTKVSLQEFSVFGTFGFRVQGSGLRGKP